MLTVPKNESSDDIQLAYLSTVESHPFNEPINVFPESIYVMQMPFVEDRLGNSERQDFVWIRETRGRFSRLVEMGQLKTNTISVGGTKTADDVVVCLQLFHERIQFGDNWNCFTSIESAEEAVCTLVNRERPHDPDGIGMIFSPSSR